MEWIVIGTAPYEETCTQVGTEDSERKMRDECSLFKRMLERLHPAPEGTSARLRIKGNPHDFGMYFEVEAGYELHDEEAANWAYGLESQGPAHWDAVAQYEQQWLMRARALQDAVARGDLLAHQVPPTTQWPVVDTSLSLAEMLATYKLPEAQALKAVAT